MRGTRPNLIGQTFGRLTVVAKGPRQGSAATWVCSCSCGGAPKPVRTRALRAGKTASCGCLHRDIITTHGHTRTGGRTSEYVIWQGILARTTNPADKAWSHYGGRGIGVCDEWLDFSTFLKDMGARPSGEHTVERLNNDLGYSKENCVWATYRDQSRNRRSSRVVEFNGESKCLVQWCEDLNLYYPTVLSRLRKARWSVDRALTTPTPKPYEPKDH